MVTTAIPWPQDAGPVSRSRRSGTPCPPSPPGDRGAPYDISDYAQPAPCQAATVIRLRHDVVATDPHALIGWYQDRANVRRGPDYYELRLQSGDPGRVEFGDLAWAVLLEGQPRSGAAQSLLQAVVRNDPCTDIGDIPDEALHRLDGAQRERIVDAVERIIHLDGFRAALATKTLHPKRRHSIPVLDNKAIFGTLANPSWRFGDRQRPISATKGAAIRAGLNKIHAVVSDPDAEDAWQEIEDRWRPRTRIELFDMCWWAALHRDNSVARAILVEA